MTPSSDTTAGTADLPTRLRRTFKAWGQRSLGDEAADEIERLRAEIAEHEAARQYAIDNEKMDH